MHRLKHIIAVDPGGMTGICLIRHSHAEFWSVRLDALPEGLFDILDYYWSPKVDVVCETYVLRKGKALQQAGSHMPAPEGIGVLRGLMLHRGPIVMLSPNHKDGGRLFAANHLPELYAERERARNEHERDAFDLAAARLRQHHLGKV